MALGSADLKGAIGLIYSRLVQRRAIKLEWRIFKHLVACSWHVYYPLWDSSK